MATRLLALLWLILSTATAEAQLALVRPNIAAPVVSSVSYNGVPVGDDNSGRGTSAAPFQTCDAALKAASSTATLWFNGNPASPPTYTCPGTVTTGLTFRGLASGQRGAVLTGTGTTAAFILAPTAGQAIAYQDVIVDPSLNTGGAAASAIVLTTASTTYSLTANNVLFRNWTTDGITTTAATGNKINLTLTNTDLTAGGVKSAIRLLGHTAGALAISGGTTTITNQSTAYWPAIYALADAAGPTASLNHTMVVGVDNSLAGANSHFGAVLANYAGATIDGSYTMTTTAALRQLYVVGLAVGDIAGGGYSLLAIDGSRLSGTVVHNGPAGGIGAFLNPDSYPIDTTKANNVVMENVYATGNGSAHGLFAAQINNPIIRNSTTTGFALGGAIKLSVAGEVYGITGSNSGSSIWQWKGGSGTGSQHGNTWTQGATFTGPMLSVQTSPENSSNANVVVAGDSFVINGAAGPQFVAINSGNTATIGTTDFHLTSGSAHAHPWADNGVNYDTTAAMKAHFGSSNTSNLP